MTMQNPSDSGHVPSGPRLAWTVAAALVVATAILATTILPAEYGIDPLGTGRLIGLTAIATSQEIQEAPSVPAGGASETLIPTVEGPIGHFPAEFKTDAVTLVVDPYQYIEYKYRLEKGATMLYTWKASTAPISDFHADPDGDPTPEPVSFDKTPKTQDSGSFTAPFSGIHGWFFENPGGDTLTITIMTAGFYSAATEFRSPRVRRQHALTPLAELVFPKPGGAPVTP